jgi:hypothetical protein
MLLGFKDRFHPMIIDGSKTHTIRSKRTLRPKPGEGCHCYGKVRQKGMHLLGRWPCVRVEEIRIEMVSLAELIGGEECPLQIWIEGEELAASEVEALLWRDGFRDHPDPSVHFGPVKLAAAFWYDQLAKGAFVGDIIHWDFRKPITVTIKRKKQ